ncbi:putative lipid II flippase FtsW [Candidatus Omnitrophota bacterium]
MQRNTRIKIFITTFILICTGMVMLYSTSSIWAWEQYGDGFYFLKRHLLFLLIGACLTFLAMCFDYRKLQQLAKPLLLGSALLLVLVLMPGLGREVAGARRWFRLGPIGFQPSELAILAMIIYIADFLTRRAKRVLDPVKGFLPPIAVMGAVCLLILMQPDFGTVLALATVVMVMIFVAGARLRHLATLFLAAIPFLYLLIFRVPYRRLRVMGFLNPWADPRGAGFQLIQSQVALGSGGIFGVGLGHSRQKLFYLPAAHTDFIFSIIGEELGLVGTLGVIFLFALLIYLGFKLVKNTRERFGFFLGLGIMLMISLKAAINIGVSCGVFPTKGLPLPFISYGGTSLVLDMIGIGIVMNISRCEENP